MTLGMPAPLWFDKAVSHAAYLFCSVGLDSSVGMLGLLKNSSGGPSGHASVQD